MRKLVKDVKVITGEECTPQTLKTIIEINKSPYTPRHKL